MGPGGPAVGGTDEKMMMGIWRLIEGRQIILWTREAGGNERR